MTIARDVSGLDAFDPRLRFRHAVTGREVGRIHALLRPMMTVAERKTPR